MTISGIKVQQEPTGKYGEVHSILPSNQFELGFAEGPMLAERSTVAWQGQDGRKKVRNWNSQLQRKQKR